MLFIGIGIGMPFRKSSALHSSSPHGCVQLDCCLFVHRFSDESEAIHADSQTVFCVHVSIVPFPKSSPD